MSKRTGSSVTAPPFSVLLVDDEQDALYGYSVMFRGAGFTHVLTETDSRAVLPLMEAQPVDLVVLDLQMPHLGGFELLTRIREVHPRVPVIIVTAANELDMAVACMKAGATDYFVKPVEKSRLVGSARRALETHDLRAQLDRLRSSFLGGDASNLGAFAGIITRSERMKRIFQYLDAVACSPQPVMVTGETGTGKELAAQAIHATSRRSGAFVAVNLAGLDDQMFSDTLFGHLKGAFTGADHKREGLVARAAGGTLFLDEIGDLQPGSQVKLLRLLQDGDYFPLGSDIPHRCEARVVAASHHDLNRLQREGKFRPDLYYRLCTHKVHLPTLAERSEDIPLLLAHFLAEAARDMNRKVPTPPPELARYLQSYSFPGNVRELRSMVYDAVAQHSRGVLSMDSFLNSLEIATESAAASPPGPHPDCLRFPNGCLPTLKEAEEALIAQAMQLADGNQGLAARYLGITRQGLNKRLNRTKTSSP